MIEFITVVITHALAFGAGYLIRANLRAPTPEQGS